MRIEWSKWDREGYIYKRRGIGCFASVAGNNIKELQRNLKALCWEPVKWEFSSYGAMSQLKRIKAK